MKKLIFCVIVFLFTQAGCRKACEHKLLPDSIKPFLFKEGSHWVFSNPLSGVNDTFSIVKSASEITEGNTPVRCSGDATTEIFDMTVVNRLDTFRTSAHGYPYIHLSKSTNSIQGNIFDASVSSGQCSTYDNRLCLTNVSSLTVGANTFNEVYGITTTMVDGSGNELFLCDMFWVKNIGVVKIILHDTHSSTFNLLSWSVVQ